MTTERVPFFRPEIDRAVLRRVVEDVDLTASSAVGPATAWAEREVGAAFCGRALLTTGATAGLEALAFVLRARGVGRAIVPSYAHVSCASAFDLAGIRVDLVDVGPDGLVDVTAVEAARPDPLTVIVAVHYAGLPCDVEGLADLAASTGATLIDDLAHCVGSRWGQPPARREVAASVVSFHLTKEVCCGEAGAVVLHDLGLADDVRRFRDRGTDRSEFEAGIVRHYSWVAPGSSIAPSELTATLLVHQIRRRSSVVAGRRRVVSGYLALLGAWAERHGVGMPADLVSRGAANTFYVLARDARHRDELMAHALDRGVGVAIHFVPLHRSARGANRAVGTLRGADRIFDRLIRLPLHSELSEANIAVVADALMSYPDTRHR